MTDEKPTGTQNSPLSILDWITGTIGKITGVLVAVIALVAALEQFGPAWSKISGVFGGGDPKRATVADCFKPSLNYPQEVSIDTWDSIDLHLEGKNDCNERLGIYVAFKVVGGRPPMTIDSHNPLCTSAKLDDPACWAEKFPLETGTLRWQISPPRLNPLQDVLGDDALIRITWIVFDLGTKARHFSDDITIRLLDKGEPN